MKVQFKKLHDDVTIPHHKRAGDAGMDLSSREDFTLVPGEQHIFKLGLAMAIPEGTVALIWDRSGMAAKHGVKTMAGVIDHTYRGELGVVLMNIGKEPYDVKKGDRIAQMLIQPVHTADVEEVAELSETIRGEGGFGSSGR
ncbi:MAG: dUTP diphosphatase [Candidatus Woesearchaeota archaeon]|nr:dUTP diphosphatase [Candidatus Woesearchaeota archaeon]